MFYQREPSFPSFILIHMFIQLQLHESLNLRHTEATVQNAHFIVTYLFPNKYNIRQTTLLIHSPFEEQRLEFSIFSHFSIVNRALFISDQALSVFIANELSHYTQSLFGRCSWRYSLLLCTYNLIRHIFAIAAIVLISE